YASPRLHEPARLVPAIGRVRLKSGLLLAQMVGTRARDGPVAEHRHGAAAARILATGPAHGRIDIVRPVQEHGARLDTPAELVGPVGIAAPQRSREPIAAVVH